MTFLVFGGLKYDLNGGINDIIGTTSNVWSAIDMAERHLGRKAADVPEGGVSEVWAHIYCTKELMVVVHSRFEGDGWHDPEVEKAKTEQLELMEYERLKAKFG